MRKAIIVRLMAFSFLWINDKRLELQKRYFLFSVNLVKLLVIKEPFLSFPAKERNKELSEAFS